MKNIVLFLYLLCFVLTGTLYAGQNQVFSNSITVPIVDKDIVFARNNAFGTLKQNLIFQAIRELIDESLLYEYQKTILRHKKFKPNDFINFVKVINEVADGQKFSMGIEGEVNMEALADFLRRINFVFKQDPALKITLVIDDKFPFSIDALKDRLKLFRIDIASVYKQVPVPSTIQKPEISDTQSLFSGDQVISPSTPSKKEKKGVNAEELFKSYPENNVLFLVQTELSSLDMTSLTGINVKILRKKDLQIINNIDHRFVVPMMEELPTEQISNLEEKFLKFFSLQSCKRDLYDAGLESTINLEVYGINDPFLRERFEQEILKKNRNIQRFNLLRLTPDLTEYTLLSKNRTEQLVNYFSLDNPSFDVVISGYGSTTIQAEVIYLKTEEISDLIEQQPSDQIIKEIRKTFKLEEEVELSEELIPGFTEKEPNNNSRQFNRFQIDQLVVSKISSRADEDIYMVEGPLDQSSEIAIDWIRIGRTSLSPQLRLYDQDFKFLNNYLLLGRQNRLRFTYTFRENPPTKIYIRISDKVGFIQGETGGYKSFNYLLKYNLSD